MIIDGGFAVVLDDINSDQAEIELRGYRWSETYWLKIFAEDDAALLDEGEMASSWHAAGVEPGGYGWAYGRERCGTVVLLQHHGASLQTVADADGWWICIQPAGDHESGVPIRIG